VCAGKVETVVKMSTGPSPAYLTPSERVDRGEGRKTDATEGVVAFFSGGRETRKRIIR